MRKITDFSPDPDEPLTLAVRDEPGPGGANHHYAVLGPNNELLGEVRFQKGGVVDAGHNGLSNEQLIAMVLDRLRAFQSGGFPSHHNQLAINGLEAALDALKARTTERLARGVEGRSVI